MIVNLGRNVLIRALAVGACLGATPAAHAFDQGLYGIVGAGLGYWSNGDASRGVLLDNLGGGSGSTDKESAAYKIGLGYQINTYNGFDLAFHDTGTFTHNIDSSPFGPVKRQRDVRRIGLSYILSIPATQRLTVMGRVGVHRWEEKTTTTVAGETFKEKRNDTDAILGLGLGYKFGDRVKLTLEYEFFHQQEDQLYQDFSELTAGLQFRF